MNNNLFKLIQIDRDMADNKIRMPSSQGGLVSFSDETKSTFNMSPLHTIIMIVVIILLLLGLHYFLSGALP